MSDSKKRVSKWKILLLGLLLIGFIIVLIMTFSKTCADQECFSKSFESCTRAKYYHFEDNNSYLYEVKGPREDNCVMTVSLFKMGMDVKDSIKERLEGKAMVCEVPAGSDVYNTKELSVHCTGPLKEALLQMTVEKLYGFVVKTFGQTLVETTLDKDLPYPVLKG